MTENHCRDDVKNIRAMKLHYFTDGVVDNY